LDKYDVGLCNKPEKEMYNRAVAPIYDIDHKYMVGCTGRSIFNKCDQCSCFHDSNHGCPEIEDRWKYCKWKHNYQFKSQNHLYNLWYAKKYILESYKVILVESPGNVWKLEENGIHNSVALFGSSLSDKQKILLDGSGAMTIISIMDSDDAGIKALDIIRNKCKNTYNIIDIKISKPDIADMTNEEIEKEIKAYL
jgi:DNA primase